MNKLEKARATIQEAWMTAGDFEGSMEDAFNCMQRGDVVGAQFAIKWGRDNLLAAQEAYADAFNAMKEVA